MIIDNESNRIIWWILRKISKELIFLEVSEFKLEKGFLVKDRFFKIDFTIQLPPFKDKEIPLPNKQWKALYKLEEMDVLSIKQKDSDVIFHKNIYHVIPVNFQIIINRKKFDKIYNKYNGFYEINYQLKYFQKKLIKNKRFKKIKKIPRKSFNDKFLNIKWKDVEIKFLNKHEVIIKTKNSTFQTNYEEMGFEDKKQKLPNKQWDLLEILAIRNGEVSWDNNTDLSLKKINAMKKRKQKLSNSLKFYFQTEEDPFYNYKTEKAYKIKCKLLPEIDLEKDIGILKEEDDLGIKEYYKEQTPEVYD